MISYGLFMELVNKAEGMGCWVHGIKNNGNKGAHRPFKQ